jgi:hypothetical protein
MNRQDWQQLAEKLKRPESIILLCASAGFIVCALFFLYSMLPELREMRASEQQLEQAEKQLAGLTAISDPDSIQDTEVERLLSQVPLSNASDQIIRAFITLQANTGVTILSMKNRAPDQESKQDVLSQYLSEQATNREQTAQATAVVNGSAARTSPKKADEVKDVETSFLEYETEMDMVGSFLQIKTFIEQLYSHERLYRIKAWSVSPGEEGRLEASLTVAYYAAPDYAPLFKEYTDQHTVKSDGTRQDPTLTDKEFRDRLNESTLP